MTKFKTTLLLTFLCAGMFSSCTKITNPRDKLIGTFNALGACQPNPYQVVIEPSSVDDDYINIKNIYEDNAVVLGLLIENKIVKVNTQIVDSNIYSGSITFDDEAGATGTWSITKNGVGCNGLLTRVQ